MRVRRGADSVRRWPSLPIVAIVCTMLGASACGGEPPVDEAQILDTVSVLVRDEFWATKPCQGLESVELAGKLVISGVFGSCRIRFGTDAIALSICDSIPAREERTLTLTHSTNVDGKQVEVIEVTASVDLTHETRERVPVDFTRKERVFFDGDGDGASTYEELCEGRDPLDPTR